MTAVLLGLTGLLFLRWLAWASVRSLCNTVVSGIRIPRPPLTCGAAPGVYGGALSLFGRVPGRAGFRACATECLAQ